MLKNNDEIRVIAPSRSMVILSEETIEIANNTLKNMGLNVSFGKNVMKKDDYYIIGSIKGRINDLHDAFKDYNVSCILTAIGGYNLNQILPYIDYELIKNNPKILCGYSDITALSNAIYAKTGLITYSGPHYSTFGMKRGNEYTIEFFKKMFFENKKIKIKNSKFYSDDAWYIDQEDRNYIKNPGMKVKNEGEAKGIILGGNLSTFLLLSGTEYFPNPNKDVILFLEDDSENGDRFMVNFDRQFTSIMQTELFKHVKGIVFGRCQNVSDMNDKKWNALLDKKELNNLPIVFDADFGHTDPRFTFPIGGHCHLKVKNNKIDITIENK